MFREFFPRAPRKQYLAPLAALQDRLGALNDAATAQLLACRAVEDVVAALDAGGETTAAAANRACGFICGFRRAEADIVAGEAAPAWAAIEAMTPYWRAPVGDAADAPPLALAAPPVQ